MKNKSVLILVLFFIIILTLNILYPKKTETPIVPIILSVTTFLFGIFASFSISDRKKRLDDLRQNDSIERGNLVLIHLHSKVFGKNFQKSIDDALDQYLMSTLDYKIWDFHKNERDVTAIYEVIIKSPPKTDQEKTAYNHMIVSFNNLVNARRQTVAFIHERLSRFEWLTATVLPLIVFLSLILIETSSIMIAIMSSLLSTMIFNVIIFLYLLDNLSWKEEQRIFEPYQRTFLAIGRLRYYPEHFIWEKRVKRYKGKKYRVGHFNDMPYPDFSKKEIETVDETILKYN